MLELKRSSEEENDEIHQRLREYNRNFMRDFQDYNFHIEQDGAIVAGIVAGSTMDTLEVEFLFVEEAYRKLGLGSKLLEYVETEAARNGLRRILLNTYSFQAPGFYEKHGYERLLKIDPCFGKFQQFYYQKTL